MSLDHMTSDGMTAREKIQRRLRPDWDYRYVPASTRQIHQGLFDGLTFEEMGVSEPYPQDHVDMASFLAGLQLVERLDAMLALHPEFNVDLLDALVRCELIHRFLTRVRG